MPISTQVPRAQHDAMAAASGPSFVWTHQNSAACAPRAAIGSEFETMGQEQERIVGEALLNKRPHPTLTPWVPPKPTLLQGIFFYQKTHMEELGFHRHRYHSIRGRKL